MIKKEILLSTTHTLEGWEIIKYLKPISSHVVIGSNVISDFIASFSDFFGGRSETYQRKLRLVYNEVTEQMKTTASEIGANAVIGMRVDIDEISGKGKNMFMITAVGTAIVAVEIKKEPNLKIQHEHPAIISVERINTLKRKKRIISDINSKRISQLDQPTLEFIIENKIHELGDIIIDLLRNSYQKFLHETPELQDQYKITITYLSNLDHGDCVEVVYKNLISEEGNRFLQVLYRIIKDLMLLDLNRIGKYLSEGTLVHKKRILQVLLYDKPHYERDDIASFIALIDLIENTFPIRGQVATQKSVFSSKEKNVWICDCGKTVKPEFTHCDNCGNDIYGFEEGLISPIAIQEHLLKKVKLIEECLNQAI